MDAMTWKVGEKVYDRWWPWDIGVITKVLKTEIHVLFIDGETVYDKAHYQFLERTKQ